MAFKQLYDLVNDLISALGVTTGAALDADGEGTLQQYARGLLKAFLARIPTLFVAAIMSIRTTAPIVVSISAVSAQSAQMTAGALYELHASVDCYYRQGATGTATTSDDLLCAGERILVYCSDATANGYIQAICATGVSGSLYLKRLL